MEPSRVIGKIVRGILRWTFRVVLCLLLLALGAFVGGFAPQLYHHFVLFPKQAAVWKALDAQRTPVSLKTGYTEYRGVMHSHSYVSHDSEVQQEEIVDAMHKAKCQFIFMTDHPVEGKLDYSLGLKGIHDGVLFVRGFELHDGFMPWGLPDGTVLDNGADPRQMAKDIRALGGVLCMAHCEARRDWDIPEIDGMEIYNIHTDLLDEMMDKHSRIEVAKEAVLNLYSYGDQTLRSVFDWWILTMLTQKWDDQSRHRKITAIAANDCHQNVGVQAVYTGQDTLMILDTGHNDPKKSIWEHKLTPFTHKLLEWCFGPLEPDKQLFRLDLDPYQRSARFVNTHLLAKELSEPALLDAVRNGRAFIAFNMLADAEGFAFVAQGNGQQVTMGEQIPLFPGLKLLAESPIPCRFALIQDGKKVADKEGKTFEYEARTPGKYRLEAYVAIPGEFAMAGEDILRNMAPWVLTNPIEVVEQTPPAP